METVQDQVPLLRCRLVPAGEYPAQPFSVGGPCHTGQFRIREFRDDIFGVVRQQGCDHPWHGLNPRGLGRFRGRRSRNACRLWDRRRSWPRFRTGRAGRRCSCHSGGSLRRPVRGCGDSVGIGVEVGARVSGTGVGAEQAVRVASINRKRVGRIFNTWSPAVQGSGPLLIIPLSPVLSAQGLTAFRTYREHPLNDVDECWKRLPVLPQSSFEPGTVRRVDFDPVLGHVDYGLRPEPHFRHCPSGFS